MDIAKEDRQRTASMSTHRSNEEESKSPKSRRRNTISITDFARARPSRAGKKNKTVSCLIETVSESSNVYTQPAISQIIEEIKVLKNCGAYLHFHLILCFHSVILFFLLSKLLIKIEIFVEIFDDN